MRIINLAGYKFVPLDRLPELKARLKECCGELGLKGTIVVSPEGINIFVSGSAPAVRPFRAFVHADSRLAGMRLKESVSSYQPFKRMLVKIKKEIITLRVPDLDPAAQRAPAVTPAELKRWLDEEREMLLLDTRNAFEVETGTFRGAVHLHLKSFGEFPRAADRLEESLRGKTIVAFCTGGIRCEKAATVLLQKGFRNVFQLEGGILQYFEDCGDAHFKGHCFVFDQRTALDGSLNPVLAGAK
ncbi:MAG: oxygen-dependent tRNA uridine(34) hydroxylase TrhO [Betaproteobacteria bacterium]